LRPTGKNGQKPLTNWLSNFNGRDDGTWEDTGKDGKIKNNLSLKEQVIRNVTVKFDIA
jgi:hypothetical protein